MIHVQNAVTISKPIEEVFGLLGDPAKDPQWHFDVVEAAPAGESQNGHGAVQGAKYRWVFDYMGEGRQEATAEVTSLEPNRELEVLAVASSGLVQKIGYRVEPLAGEGARVTRTLDLEHSDLPPQMENEIKLHIENRGAQYLARLKYVLEVGPVEPGTETPSCICSEPGL